nr:C-glucosyltransferase [Carthamus tinctorius]
MSTTADLRRRPPPHIALFPSAGMGHLTPLLRLASMLASRSCHVTLVTAEPAVSAAETAHITAFLAAYPAVNRLPFQTLPFTPPAVAADPFFVQFEAINRSVHLLAPTLSSASPPVSAVFSDIASVAGVGRVADELRIPIYVVSTTSARFTALVASMPALIGAGSSLPTAEEASSAAVGIPGLDPFEISALPPPFFVPDHLFTKTLVANALAMRKAKGVLTNTFSAFEPETIAAVNGGKSIPDFPPFLPIGPLQPHKLELGDQQPLPWLDQQPPHSVAYVSFGSRTALSQSQIAELRKGLAESGRSFLWVVKSKVVDKDDTESDLDELVGNSSSKGMVVKGWVNQESILSHPAIGCFVSHCGWNSAVEAAAAGVPVVAWPQSGDQKVNAAVVEAAGLGRWEKGWGWSGERLVKSGEIAEKVKMVMDDEKLREKARRIGEEAKEAIKEGGSSHKVLMEIIEGLSKDNNVKALK